MKKLILFFTLLYFSSFSQNTFNTFITEDNLNLTCRRVLETTDNSYIINCSTNIGVNFEVFNKTRLIKIDYQGNVLWDKVYTETSSSEFFGKTVNAFDGGYLMADESYSNPAIDEDTLEDILVRKIGVNGNIEWQKIYPSRTFSDIIQTSDSSYLLLGQVHEQNGYFSSDVIVYKIDINGNIIWKNRYGQKNENYPSYWESTKNIYELNNSYYITGLWHRSDSSIYSNGFIYKLNNLGNKQWELNYPYKDIHTKARINSIFKLKDNYYFNSYWNKQTYLLDIKNGKYSILKKHINIKYSLGKQNRNYSIDCNIITTIYKKDSFWMFEKYNDIEEPYYSKRINKINENQINSLIVDFQKTKDGGYVFLRGGTKPNEWLITKADCSGNDTYWSTECNRKLKEENNILIYPNPTNKLLNIETNYVITNTEIINILGQTISYDNYCNCNKQTINIENLPNGNYFIHIKGVDLINTAKFTKQ